MLTQQELNRLLNYDPDTGHWEWLVSTSMRVKVGDRAGYTRHDGYLCIRIHTVLYLAHRLAWLYVNGHFPSAGIDHIDRNKANCRLSNLRPATQSQNMRNRRHSPLNTSGYRGVYWEERKGKWFAKIVVERKQIHLGYFLDPKDADAAYQTAAKKLHGEFVPIITP